MADQPLNLHLGQAEVQGQALNHVTMNDITNICCIGATPTSVCTMLVMASHWPNKNFIIVDDNAETINRWQGNANLPFEPGLQALLTQQRGQNLQFSTLIQNAVFTSRIVFVAVDVGTKTTGEGMNGRLDFSKWKDAMRTVLSFQDQGRFIVEMSSFPIEVPGRLQELLIQMSSRSPTALTNHIFSNPWFFPTGGVIHYLQDPSQVIIAPRTAIANISLISELYGKWIPHERIITNISAESAQLGKMACNVILAMNSITMNYFALLCEKFGGDIADVERIVRGDRRISRRHLRHNAGVGGEGLQRDVQYCAHCGTTCAIEPAAKLFKCAIDLNKRCKEIFVKEMLESMDSLTNINIAVMGFSSKENSSDIQDTPALYICERLLQEGANIRIHDPIVPVALIRSCFRPRIAENRLRVIQAQDIQQTWQNADAICFLLRCQEFATIHLPTVFGQMNHPAYFFDACNFATNTHELRNMGFFVRTIGRP